MKRLNAGVVVAVTAAFAVGVFAGASMKRSGGFGDWRHGNRQARMLELFSKKLNLDEAQRAAAGAILSSKHEQLMTLRETVRPKFQEIRTQTHAQIRELLKPEQVVKFEQMEAEFEARRESYKQKWSERSERKDE